MSKVAPFPVHRLTL